MTELRVAKQGGWIGLVVILVALVIVAMLAKDALRQYGLVPGAAAPTNAGSPGERARAPVASGVDAFDAGTVEVAPTAPMDRARGLQESVKRQADERAARTYDAGK
jgi:hypothetical protein